MPRAGRTVLPMDAKHGPGGFEKRERRWSQDIALLFRRWFPEMAGIAGRQVRIFQIQTAFFESDAPTM